MKAEGGRNGRIRSGVRFILHPSAFILPQQHVRRLQIPVYDARLVRGVDAAGDGGEQFGDFHRRKARRGGVCRLLAAGGGGGQLGDSPGQRARGGGSAVLGGEKVGQRPAGENLQGEVRPPAAVPEFVPLDDVRVPHRRDRLGFGQKAEQLVRAGGLRAE